jgi:glycosyltransferase involved in cell wall biosynthesis
MPYLPVPDYLLSLPNKAIEYLSASLPVVTSLVGGYAEQVLRSADCGVFYGGGRPAELARALGDLVGDSEKLERMRRGAMSLFERSFTADRVCSAMVEHVEAVGQLGVDTQMPAPVSR